MTKRAKWMCGLCGALSASCSNSAPTSPSTGPDAGSLVGTWNLTTTATGGVTVLTTVTIGQDSLGVTSPDFTLTASRTSKVLAFTDTAPPNGSNAAVLGATQTVGAFNAGVISIRLQEGATAASRTPRGAIALALGGVLPEELTRLRECLAESTDAAVRRAAPMLFDLEGSEDDAAVMPAPLRPAMPELPALTAAANMLGAPWDAPGISVELGPACEIAASRCVPLFAPSPAVDRGDALVRRGLTLAWTLGNAALLRVPVRSRGALVQSLREAQTRPSGTIALVFDAPQGVVDEAELELLRAEARRALAHLAPEAPQRPWLDALVAAQADWALPIALNADEVLVIPRLSALARLQDFHSEVELARTFE